MRFLDYVAVGVLVVLTISFCAPARSAEPEPEMRYYGTTPEGVRIYTVCLDGQWLAYSAQPDGRFHILAPYIREKAGMGVGVDLPTCKGKGQEKPRP
jgi:hypothetical protein